MRRAEIFGVIIDRIEQTQNLITMEAELSTSINIDNSWGNWGMFSSIDEITYYATGIFTTDLSSLSRSNSRSNIILDELEQIFYFVIERPRVHSITMHLEETQFEVNRGFFRFGEVSLTPEEHIALQMQAENMFRIIMFEELMTAAYEYTMSSVHNLLENVLILAGFQDFEIVILWQT